MLVQGCGYGAGSIDKESATTIARILREDLKMVMRETGADCVVGTGYSGLSMLYYLKCFTANDIPLIGVKKAESHGWWYVRLDNSVDAHDMRKFIFLDDFIASGKTEETVVRRLTGTQEMAAGIQEEPRCQHVASVLYSELQEQYSFGFSTKSVKHLKPVSINDAGVPRYRYTEF